MTFGRNKIGILQNLLLKTGDERQIKRERLLTKDFQSRERKYRRVKKNSAEKLNFSFHVISR